MSLRILCLLCVLLLMTAGSGAAFVSSASSGAQLLLSADDMMNITCLREAYPEILDVEQDEAGIWLVFAGERRVLYGAVSNVPSHMPKETVTTSALDVDVRRSMQEPYYLEPIRPKTEAGYAPGRRRSYALLKMLYGGTKHAVSTKLMTVHTLGQQWKLSPRAAQAFQKAGRTLETILLAQKQKGKSDTLSPWLRSSGTFCWRRILGETTRSPHSYGIAVDIGAGHGAAYWRWSSVQPHPQQANYPTEIVEAFEKAGFIWGGKWHEYDIMHFEYRPELICKARKMLSQAGRVTESDDQQAIERASLP